MDEWAIAIYGDPCRECGFGWSMPPEAVVELVRTLPVTYGRALGRASGRECHPDLAWSVTAYVCHVADNLRIWAERLQGVLLGTTVHVEAYDENRLAEVRGYDRIDLAAARWSLRQSSADWTTVVRRAFEVAASGRPIRLHHSERGQLAILEVVRSNAHDATHHRWDIERIVAHGTDGLR